MRGESIWRIIAPLVGAVVILIAAYAFDRWAEVVRAAVSREFIGAWKLVWIRSLSKVVTMGLLLGLWRGAGYNPIPTTGSSSSVRPTGQWAIGC